MTRPYPADMDRRLGRFRIENYTLRCNPERALAILRGCIVVRAEALWHTDAVEYMACHHDFDPVPIGQEPPHYSWALNRDSPSRIWLRQSAP